VVVAVTAVVVALATATALAADVNRLVTFDFRLL
jgi:hypothetical protein